MEWTAEVEAGDWVRERIDDPWRATMHDVVPRGFAAYARIFHPGTRDRPVYDAWPGLPYVAHRREWDAFQARNPEIVGERVSWTDTATAMGTTMHAGAQWGSIVAPGLIVEHEDGPRDSAGWRYADPAQGDLAPDILAVVAQHLAAHTATPDAGFIAVWEGWGGLLGHVGAAPARTFLQTAKGGGASDTTVEHHNVMLGRSIHDPFNSVFTKPTWQPGALSDEISRAPRFELPNRDHVLFRGGIAELAEPDWVLRAPWRDRDAEAHGLPPSAHAPSLTWPADAAWVLVTDVDYDSTIVGGTAELVSTLCDDPRVEALSIREGANLGWDADEVNR